MSRYHLYSKDSSLTISIIAIFLCIIILATISAVGRNIHPAYSIIDELTLNGNGWSMSKTSSCIDHLDMAFENYNKEISISSNNDAGTLSDTERSIVLYDKGLALLNLGRANEAVESLELALEAAPKNDDCFLSDIQYSLALAHLEMGRDLEAIQLLDKLLTVYPNAPDILTTKGLVLYNFARYNEAIEYYDKALEIDPNYADALNNKGNALLKLDKAQEAIENYDRAQQQYQSNQSKDYGCERGGFRNLPTRLSEEARIPFLIHHGEIGINPSMRYANHINSHYLIYFVSLQEDTFKELSSLTNKGTALANTTKYKEAIEVYEAVLVIKPDFVPALYHMAEAYEKGGDYKKALDLYKQAQSLDPDYHGENIGLTEIGKSKDAQESGLLVIFSKELVRIVQ